LPIRQEADALMDLPNEAQRRISQDNVAWLTTITDRGVPAPNPVWFVPDGDDLVVFSAPHARKARNIEQRPTVTLHFNSDPDGGDVVVITGVAALAPGRRPSALGAYLDKYEATITGPLARPWTKSTGPTTPRSGSDRPASD
jgi:PPOX class probable F420-dependent enzyme